MAGPAHPSEAASLADFLQLLRLRRTLVLEVWATVVLGVAGVTALLPRWYLAEAVVRVEKPEGKDKLVPGRELAFDPYFLQDQYRLIQSAKILHPVIEKLGLNERLGRDLGFGGPLPTDLTYEYLLKKMVRVDSPRGSSLIEVGVLAQDPALAAAMANAIVRVYEEERIQYATAEQRESLVQLRKELEAQERAVSVQRDAVETLRRDLGISGVDLNARYSDMEIETLRQMQNSLIAMSVEAIGRKTRYERFRAIPEAERMALVNAELIQDQNIQNLLQAYFVSEQQVTKLESRLGEAHPDLIAAMEGRDQVKAQLLSQLRGYESALEIAYKEAEARVEELKAQLAQAKVDQILSARDKMRPFEEAVQKLEDETRLASTLKINVRQREVDFQAPRRSIELLNAAEVPRRPHRPSWTVNLSLALGLGALLAVGLAVGLDLLDRSLRNVAEVEARLGRPVLAVVPRRNDAAGQDPTVALEPFRVLHANLGLAVGREAKNGPGGKVLVLVSAGPGEGKSTTAQQLALAMGEAGERVLLVDGDLRRPTQHQRWGRARGPGLAEWVQGKADWGKVVQAQCAPGVDFVPAGDAGRVTLSLLYGERLRGLLAELRQTYGWIIVDAPPVIGVSDTAVLAKLSDYAVLVVQHRRNPASMVERAQLVLKEVGVPLTGVVLNRVPERSGDDYEYYTRNYAYYQRDEKEPEKGDADSIRWKA